MKNLNRLRLRPSRLITYDGHAFLTLTNIQIGNAR